MAAGLTSAAAFFPVRRWNSPRVSSKDAPAVPTATFVREAWVRDAVV
ncbi:hypothetical protein [Streptomyces sp. NPDC057877]